MNDFIRASANIFSVIIGGAVCLIKAIRLFGSISLSPSESVCYMSEFVVH